MSYLSLKIFKDGQLIKTKIFTEDQVSIGSSEGLSLQLEGIAPWHLLIEKKGDIFCILDLNSDTGTKLNGQKITDETPISSGSKISIGPYELEFFVGPPKAQEAEKSVKPKAPPVPEAKAPPVPEPVDVEETATVSEELEDLEKTQASSPPPRAVPTHDKVPAQRVSQNLKKGFWKTYAPTSKIKKLDDFLTPSIGNLIEVLVCWQERILSTHYFYKNGDVFMGSGKDCEVKFPNMLGKKAYKLLSIVSGAKIYLNGIRGLLIQGKDKSTRTTHSLESGQSVVLKPYEMVRLDFNASLKVYVRLTDKPSKPPFAGLLNLKMSEAMALFLAFLLTGLLVFYGSLYAPAFLADDINFIEKDIRIAKVVFQKAPVVEYDLSEKTTVAQTKKAKKPAVQKKRATVKTLKKIIKKRVKRPIRTPRKGKQGKLAAQAPGKKRTKKAKVTVGSVRPGGSIKTGKKGASAKTVAPDPTKVGIVGAFGKGGKLSQLDKGATGSGGLLGLAEESTGYAGTKESYAGEGIGTKTKDLGSGGQGSAVVGISGIKTRGKGLGKAGTGAGGLGERGRMSIEFGTEDIDVAGEIDKGAILQALRRNQSKFQRCYQMSLNEKPSIQGNLEMKWLISASGRGRQAKAVDNPMGSNSLANCVSGVLENLNFPQPPAGQIPSVRFTFRFYL